jgi:hypothetical protein
MAKRDAAGRQEMGRKNEEGNGEERVMLHRVEQLQRLGSKRIVREEEDRGHAGQAERDGDRHADVHEPE